MNSKTKKKIRIILKSLKKNVKPWQLIFVIVLLVANTLAWFIYANEVSNTIDVHVRAWNILFKDGDEDVTNYIDFTVSNIYPGMDDFTQSITMYNDGEVGADVSYKILEVNILGDTIVTREGKIDAKEDFTDDDMSSDDLEAYLLANYPFKMSFSLDSTSLSAMTGTNNYHFTVTWPFESGDDELDTEWGQRSYFFQRDNVDTPCITIKAMVLITQAVD